MSSYKERMHPQVAKAEIEVFKKLSTKGLTKGLVTQKPIVLRTAVPDFCWPDKRKVVFLDGLQVHMKTRVEARDEEINDLLERQGWKVLRISYVTPMNKAGLEETVKMIESFLEA